jgi:hypothetical protein
MVSTLERGIKHQEKKEENKDPFSYVLATLNIPVNRISEEIERIDAAARKVRAEGKIIVSTHTLDPDAAAKIKTLERKYKGLVEGLVIDNPATTYADSYAQGILKGADKAVKVIQIDSGGGHQPEELDKFVKGLKEGYDVVLGSRFMKGGDNKYPLTRRLGSQLANTYSHLAWGTPWTDTSSGFRGYTDKVVTSIFQVKPMSDWISIDADKGPIHLVQNEEALIIYLLMKLQGIKVKEVPIKYGLERQGGKLDLLYNLKAFKGMIEIGRSIPGVSAKISNLNK